MRRIVRRNLYRADVPPVWLNGRLVDPSVATVAVSDHGLTVGDGVFETMRTERGVPFAMSRHLRRLRRGLDGLGLELRWSDDELRSAMTEVAAAFPSTARIRLTVTGGPGPLGSNRGEGGATVVVAGEAAPAWPETGAAVTVPWTRNERSAVAGLKTTSYAENVVALAAAKAAGANEAILANTAGALCEGTGSNVFVVLHGRALTPPLSSGCLPGITRELVLECSEAEEADLTPDDLSAAEEVFLTSSTRDVQGQHRIDDRRLEAPGPVTRRVARAFARLVADDLDP